MRVPPLLSLVLVAGVVAIAAALWERRPTPGDPKARARRLLGERDRQMLALLAEAAPAARVLAQVAVSSLVQLRAPDRARYRRAAVDFVLLDAGLDVLAVILVDDASEAAGQALGEPLAELLERAGYRTLQFREVPDAASLRTALGAGAQAT